MATTNQSVTAPHILRRQQGQTPEKNLGKVPGIPQNNILKNTPRSSSGAEQFRQWKMR